MNLLSMARRLRHRRARRRGRLGRAARRDRHPTPVPPFIPMIMFAVLFGLSMDYEVFLLSRVREAFDAGATPPPPSPRP